MAQAPNNASFLGTGWAFPPRFTRHGQTGMVNDERDIHESLIILLSTRPGERVMHPLYGCGLNAMVFEHVSDSVETEIRVMVTSAIARCEPRVTTELVVVYPSADDAAVLLIEIAYRIRATNTVQNLVFPFYMGEGSAQPGGASVGDAG